MSTIHTLRHAVEALETDPVKENAINNALVFIKAAMNELAASPAASEPVGEVLRTNTHISIEGEVATLLVPILFNPPPPEGSLLYTTPQPTPALIEAARMALEAMEYHIKQTRPIIHTVEAIAALRAALKEGA